MSRQIENKESNGNTAVEKQSNPKCVWGGEYIKGSKVYLNWSKNQET